VSGGKIVPSDIATESGNESSRDWTLDGESIKDFLGHHFPRRRESLASKVALIKLIQIVSERSCTSTKPETTAVAVHRFGITLGEFFEFEREEQ